MADVAAATRIERGHQGRLCRLGCLRERPEAEGQRERKGTSFLSTSNRCSGGSYRALSGIQLCRKASGLHGRGMTPGVSLSSVATCGTFSPCR